MLAGKQSVNAQGQSWGSLAGQAIGGVLGSAALAVLGGFAGPWLADVLQPESGADPLVWSVIGLLMGAGLGAGLGVYVVGRALGQGGAVWATLLGALLGGGLGMGLITIMSSLTQSPIAIWAVIGLGATALALVGYKLTCRI